jgi:cystathionine beta-lyase/cystathionine gamma-synthase
LPIRRWGKAPVTIISRLQNPTREHLEVTVAKLENGADAMAFSTGWRLSPALMELFAPADHIIASDDLYGVPTACCTVSPRKTELPSTLSTLRTVPSLLHTSARRQKRYWSRPRPTDDAGDRYCRCVVDLPRPSSSADCGQHLSDTLLSKPILLGADIVVHSGTKYLCGHNDTLAGFLVVKDTALSERLRYIYKTTGACLSPFDSWLLIRGIKTLSVRMERQQQSAMRIAEWLCAQKSIRAVHYAGLPPIPTMKFPSGRRPVSAR